MSNKPFIDQSVSENLETATFAMGCFWSPDAIFGALDGVIRTRVGYAGGDTENPTYRNLGSHIETLQLDYDPQIMSYERLLELFFAQHTPTREPWKRQYTAAVFFHDTVQEQLIYQKKEALEKQLGKQVLTEINPYEAFYLAEERHQKYKLQRQPELLAEFRAMYPDTLDFINSTAAARVNGYLYACESCESLIQDLGSFGLSARGQKILLDTATNQQGVACSRALQ